MTERKGQGFKGSLLKLVHIIKFVLKYTEFILYNERGIN